MSFDDILNNNPLGLYFGAVIFILLGVVKFIQDSRKDRKEQNIRKTEDDYAQYVEKVRDDICEDVSKMNDKISKISDRVSKLADRVSRLEGSFEVYFNQRFKPKSFNSEDKDI